MFVCCNFIFHHSPLCLLTCLTPMSCMFILHFVKNPKPTLLVLHACCTCLESLKKKSLLCCECFSCIFANNTFTCLASLVHLCLACFNLMSNYVSHILLLNVCLAPYKAHASPNTNWTLCVTSLFSIFQLNLLKKNSNLSCFLVLHLLTACLALSA